MRWPVFLIAAFVFLIIQLSVRNVLTLYSLGGISPDFMACLAVFMAMFASRMAALWACWLLGVLMDLAPSEQTSAYHVLGPHALGYVFGCVVVLQLRSMVFRRRALTIGFLTLVTAVAASLVAIFILAVRSWYPDAPPFRPLQQFGLSLLGALYSAVMAVPIGVALNATHELWGFQSGAPRRGWS